MKKITSLSLAFSFLIMTYTGLMLFIVPHGRVAYWSDWYLFGLSKGQYGELHTTSMVLFISFVLLHIYYNWRPLLSYMKDKSKKVSFTKKEFLVALVLNVLFVLGTLTQTPPFKTFLDFGEGIKDFWTQEYGEPPYGHAEETKLNIFCKKLKIDLEEAKTALRTKNIIFDEYDTLKKIAQVNLTSPSEIYKLIKKENILLNGEKVPSNLGRKTLQKLADLKKINLQRALEILNKKGIENVDSESRMRNLADELEITPLELYKLIQN